MLHTWQEQWQRKPSLITYLARFNVVDPTCDLGLSEDQWMRFDEFHLFLDGLIKVREFQELDDIGGSGNFSRIGLLRGGLELLSKLGGRKRLHPTVGVVEHGDLAGSQQALGDDQRSDRILPVSDKINARP